MLGGNQTLIISVVQDYSDCCATGVLSSYIAT